MARSPGLKVTSKSSAIRVSTGSGSLRVTTTFGLLAAMRKRSNPNASASRWAGGPPPFSSGAQGGQRRFQAGLLAGLAAIAAGAASAAPPKETPSGLPVPRYVATRFKEVNARGGPGDDYALKWVYRAAGVPLQVVEETAAWRRVCDPDGGLAWVHGRTVTTDRRVMNLAGAELPMRSAPSADARLVARLAPRATAAVGACKKGWCRLTIAHVSGWSEAARLWGTADAPQCR